MYVVRRLFQGLSCWGTGTGKLSLRNAPQTSRAGGQLTTSPVCGRATARKGSMSLGVVWGKRQNVGCLKVREACRRKPHSGEKAVLQLHRVYVKSRGIRLVYRILTARKVPGHYPSGRRHLQGHDIVREIEREKQETQKNDISTHRLRCWKARSPARYNSCYNSC